MGIKDTAFASLFDKNDLPYLYRLAEEVRITHNQDLVNDFNNSCQRKWNDHNPILDLGNKKIEFLDIMKSLDGDLVVDVGMQRIIDLILGTSTNRWARMNVATGNAVPAITDTTLSGGALSVQFSVSGWAEFASTSLRFAGIFGESTATITPRESGVYNDLQTVLLNRNMFQNFNFTHTINVTGFIISNIIEFVPVM